MTDLFPHNYYVINDYDALAIDKSLRPYIRTGDKGPPTVILNGGKGNVNLSDLWMAYLARINTAKALTYLIKPASGWHNTGSVNNLNVRQVVLAGNIVQVLRIEGNQAFIQAVFNNDNPPAVLVMPMPNKLNPLIHLFSIQYGLQSNYPDHLDMTTDSRYARYFPMANPGEQLWIDARNLRRLP
jgi:hypothetical protein